MKERISREDGLLKCFKGPHCWLVSCKTGFTLPLCFYMFSANGDNTLRQVI